MATSPGTVESIAKRVRRIQALTIAWMILETCASLAAAWKARSPALLAFGGDSAVELVSAAVALWIFRSHAKSSARWPALVAGSLLFVLAVIIVFSSALMFLGYREPESSYLGIVVLCAAALFMPWLARQKRRLSAETQSVALRADAVQSDVCGYLSIIALAGLVLNSIWHLRWADPVAALLIVPIVVYEGWKAISGEACSCSNSGV